VSLLQITRDKLGALRLTGRSWDANGALTARYWSEAAREEVDPAGIYYFWKGERPRDPDAPEFQGIAEIRLESIDRANGFYSGTGSAGGEPVGGKTSGIYLRADPGDRETMDGNDAGARAALLERRITAWRDLGDS
jgi:hypothetical protein